MYKRTAIEDCRALLKEKLKECVKAGLKDGLVETGVLCRQPASSSVANMVPS